ncbi:MAG: hypothetical protein H0U76_07585, partial [Ktedonobacteraceae bacterium]|nr:hypothetical protein [Ktedonobacteraceae bacterium]
MSQNSTSRSEIHHFTLGSFTGVVINDDHLQFPPEVAAATALPQELDR